MYNVSVTTATTHSPADLDRSVALFHALSDATRLSILEMLRDGERCVCELQAELDAAQSRLSFHLRVLKDAGLITDRREGRWSYYTIAPGALAEVHDVVVAMQPVKSGRALPQVGSCCG
jgi:ArsR family transcriptional regulator